MRPSVLMTTGAASPSAGKQAEPPDPLRRPPGTEYPRKRRRLDWELITCGVRGHAPAGDNAKLTAEQRELVFSEADGVRWHRCLRCDSWLPVNPPAPLEREHPRDRDEIELPLRGKALRDRIVLRVIAIDRAFHFVVLALLAVAVFLFASHQLALRTIFFRIVNAVQGTSGAKTHAGGHGLLHTLQHVFELRSQTLYLLAAGAAAYAVLEGVEAVGLWYQKRWAEYLTFVATCVFLPYEVWELTKSVSPFKAVALAVNLAIAIYLLYAKRLFGLRGGGDAEARERAHDVGWEALERTAPRA